MGISLEKFRLVGQKIFAGPLLCVRPVPDPGGVARNKATGPGPTEPTVRREKAVEQANRQGGLATGVTGKKIKRGRWIEQLGPRWPVTWVVGKGLSQLPTGCRAHTRSLSTQWNATQPGKGMGCCCVVLARIPLGNSTLSERSWSQKNKRPLRVNKPTRTGSRVVTARGIGAAGA